MYLYSISLVCKHSNKTAIILPLTAINIMKCYKLYYTIHKDIFLFLEAEFYTSLCFLFKKESFIICLCWFIIWNFLGGHGFKSEFQSNSDVRVIYCHSTFTLTIKGRTWTPCFQDNVTGQYWYEYIYTSKNKKKYKLIQ